MADDATRAILYAISHDLQAPLRHIHGYLHLLEESEGRLDDAGRRHFAALRDNAARMQRMLDAALTLSRLETEPLEPTDVDLAALVRAAIDELREHPRAGEVAWTVDDLPVVRGDAPRLTHLVRELARNVLDHGATTARVHAEVDAAPGTGGVDGTAATRLVFDDQGPGFPAKFGERVTGLYQTLQRDDHVGAGLAVAARVAQQHGGTLHVDAEEGRGVRVTVTLRGP